MTLIEHVAIAIATYKRPEGLKRLLDSLVATESNVAWKAIIVDNDEEGSASTIVKEYDERFEYAVEPKPGIPSVRNRSLELAVATGADAIVFVDDDQVVPPNWLQELVNAAHHFESPVVAGPVIPVFPAGTPDWMLRDGYFKRRVRKTGERSGVPATGNVLIRTAVIQEHSPTFDPKFTITGGSDSDFFLKLKKKGVAWVWSSEAVAYEILQTERVSRRWLFWRYVRGGEVFVMLDNGKLAILYEFLRYTTIAAAALPLSFVIPRLRPVALVSVARILGIIRGALGFSTREYAR